MSTNNKKTISNHVFLFPFSWETEKKDSKEVSQKRIIEYFENSTSWESTDLPSRFLEGFEDSLDEEEGKKKYKDYYNIWQYFFPTARKAVLGLESGIVRNFQFRATPEKYKIKKTKHTETKESIKYEYELRIQKITVQIYNTGIAIFSLFCEYPFDEDAIAEDGSQTALESIKKINDFGRRIMVPFLAEGGCSIIADELSIYDAGKSEPRIFENFKKLSDFNNKESELRRNPSYISSIILRILNDGCGDKDIFVTGEKCFKEQIQIRQALDDRMFVCCHVEDKQLSDQSLAYDTIMNGNEQEKKENFTKNLYELLFVDGDGCTCQSGKMREALLEKHIYKRWLEDGTLYGFTNQAFLSIKEPKEKTEFLRSNFLNMYVPLCTLALAQKASAVKFQNEAAKLSVEAQKSSFGNKSIYSLMDLNERFIVFLNQLDLHEISSQEQAIEMYDMLRNTFQIEERNGNMLKQISCLHEASQTQLNLGFNKWAAIFALFAILVSAIPMIVEHQRIECGYYSGWAVAAICGIGIIVFLFIYKSKR